MEETNARYVESLPEPVSLATVDASFISLKILLPVVKRWLLPPFRQDQAKLSSFANEEKKKEESCVVALIKPQFEAGKKDVARGDGVIRDPEIHRQVLLDVLGFAQTDGFQIRGLIKSPLLGPKGNAEFLVWLNFGSTSESVEELVEKVVPLAQS
jgi:23S rRNA (cytidine1920-2'-O)/16S rRNA (cytidine1409-2'-O)-methyltransferase